MPDFGKSETIQLLFYHEFIAERNVIWDISLKYTMQIEPYGYSAPYLKYIKTAPSQYYPFVFWYYKIRLAKNL